ncbi:MAG: chemotaxis protein CheW [Gemmatimonadota bacterium]|nr:MAG: chemotaxis protein CheW [Gemmatimonadota bacterium]
MSRLALTVGLKAVAVTSLLTFRVGEARYALPAEMVNEVVEIGPIIHDLPGSDEDRLGLALVRGRWIPVLELARAVEGAQRLDPEAKTSVLLVLGAAGGPLGLRVETFGDVVQADVHALRGPRHAEGLVELDGELFRYVDPEPLLGPRAERVEGKGRIMREERMTSEPLQVVAFRVGGEEFGIDIMKVHEVLHVPELRGVPKAPDFVEGVMRLRELLVPVIEMRKRFSLPEREREFDARLLVVSLGAGRAGLMVDEVPGVTPIPDDALSPPPEFFKGLAGRFLQGIAQLGDRLIILLDVDEILSSKERIALERMQKAVSRSDEKAAAAGESRGKKRARRRTKKRER